MKKRTVIIIAMLLSITFLSGCSQQSEPPKQTETTSTAADTNVNNLNEDPSVQIIRSIMELDYSSMTVAEFNETIQLLCENEDTNIFEVMSDAYDYFTAYNDSGEFISVTINDHNLESFIQTTLTYSAAEIFNEPVHMGSVIYMTMPDITAKELSLKIEQMSLDDWDRFYEENISEISIFPALSYLIEADIPDSNALLLSERDGRLNEIHIAIKDYFLGLDTETVSSETLEENLLLEFERLSVFYSDEKIGVKCLIQDIESDIY